jgi:hypothetical protein
MLWNILRIIRIKLECLASKPYQPSLMFVSNDRKLPKNGSPERYFTQVRSGIH